MEEEGKRKKVISTIRVIPMASTKDTNRHGLNDDGSVKPYKGYRPDSNYCMDVYTDDKGKWVGRMITTFEAYQLARVHGNDAVINGLPFGDYTTVMRLRRNDVLRLKIDDQWSLFRLAQMKNPNILVLISINEANADARVRAKELSYKTITPSGLQKHGAKVKSVGVLG